MLKCSSVLPKYIVILPFHSELCEVFHSQAVRTYIFFFFFFIFYLLLALFLSTLSIPVWHINFNILLHFPIYTTARHTFLVVCARAYIHFSFFFCPTTHPTHVILFAFRELHSRAHMMQNRKHKQKQRCQHMWIWWARYLCGEDKNIKLFCCFLLRCWEILHLTWADLLCTPPAVSLSHVNSLLRKCSWGFFVVVRWAAQRQRLAH